MKMFTRAAVVCAVLMFAGAVFAQTSTEPYGTVEIERFGIAQGVEFPENDLNELMSYMVTHFNRSRRFQNVFLSSDAASGTAEPRRAKIVGTVSKYAKGSRAARYLIGLGAGRTKLVADVKVVDAETGDVLFEQKVDGHVYGGFFGGQTDAAKSGLASEIIKTMTKKGYARKERIKS